MEPTEKKTPTKDEWATFIKRLSGLYGQVKLLVDGYEVTVQRRLVGKNRLSSVVYVNGEIKGKWIVSHREGEAKELPEETRRFWQQKTKSFCSAEKIKAAQKALGKRRAAEIGYGKRWIYYTPEWPSARSLMRHLLKHNDSIEIVEL